MQVKKYGYARISTKDQREDRQVIALREAGIAPRNIYVDKISGKDFNRPQYQKLLKKLDENSVLYIESIDRLGRNYEELTEQWRRITKERKTDIVVLDMPLLDTRKDKNLLGTIISDIVLVLLGYVAENERTEIRKRQAEGIAAAQARGVRFGRPEIPIPENFELVIRLWREGTITMNEAAGKCEMKPKTFYEKARKFEKSIG